MKFIETNSILPVIEECIATDKDLIRHHSCPIKSAKACAKYTEDVLNENKKHWGEMKFYSVMHKDSLIGFIGVFPKEKILSSFMIKPLYRKPNIHRDFQKELRKLFEGNFYVYLFKDNIKARAYFEKNNATKISIDDQIVQYICQ